MFDKYEQFKQLFDTLKEKKFSRVVRNVREALLAKLNGPQFSPLVREYLQIMNPNGVPFTNFSAEPAQISQIKKIINALYHTEMALKDAEKVDFRDINKGFGEITSDFSRLWNDTVHQTYLACELFTHFDVDLWTIFSDEIDLLAPLITKFQTLAINQGADALDKISKIDGRGIPHEVGKAFGHVIDQMGSQQDDVNYEVLTQFSAKLPGYLDQLSGMIENFSSNVSEHEPTLDKAKLDVLQDQALQLVSAIERSRGSSIFLPIRTLHYLHIIRSSIMLSMSIFEQAGHLNDSTQNAVRAKLAQLKYKLLPMLFGLTDKIEQQALLKPGLLSNPLMNSVSALYQTLVGYTQKFVDFSQVGGELLTLNCQHFVSSRLSQLHERSAAHQVTRLKADEVARATQKFYQILNKPQYRDLRLIDLPITTKQLLLSHYKVMQPDVLKLHTPMNNAIITGLMGQKTGVDVLSAPMRWLNRAVNALWAMRHAGPSKAAHLLNTDSVADVYLLKPLLEAQVEKIITTQDFYIQLNANLCDEISSGVKALKLFPYTPSKNPWNTHEVNLLKAAANKNRLCYEQAPRPFTESQTLKAELNEKRWRQLHEAKSVDRLDLSMDEALILYQAARETLSKVEKAEEAYRSFCELLHAEGSQVLLKASDDELRMKLCNYYAVFQPYFVSALGHEVSLLDGALVSTLSQSATVFGPQQRLDVVLAPFERFDSEFRQCLQTQKAKVVERSETLALLSQKLMRSELGSAEIMAEGPEQARAHYVLQRKHYSKAIAEVSASLFELTSIFNTSVSAQLKKASQGVPFPELMEPCQAFAQSEQVLGIKRLFNCLYHLEQIAMNLEKLNDQSTESVYTYSVFTISLHLRDAIYLAQALVDTPSLAVFGVEIKAKLKTSYEHLLDIRNHYLHEEKVAEEGVEPAPDPALNHSPALYYALDVLKILPYHIKALREDEALDPDAISAMQREAAQVTTDIERVLHDSNSYFKLFFEIPTMYRLFRELKQQLLDLTTVSHEVAMTNLARIQDEHLTNMLIEGDRLEDQMGFLPGTLTTPLKEVLDTFYQGLVMPLGLSSKRHLALVSSEEPTKRRQQAAKKRGSEASLEIKELEDSQSTLLQLQARIKYYREFHDGDPALLATIKSLIKADYQTIVPLLTMLTPQLEKSLLPDEFGRKLDKMLNGTLENGVPMTSIEERIAMGVSYFEGKLASCRLVIGATLEKKSYLEALKEKQIELNARFVEKYTLTCFQKQVKTLVAKQIGFIHCSREYGVTLAAHLEQYKAGLVLAAQGDEDIDKKMNELLREKASQFEHEHYKDYYHLETLMAAVDRLKYYIHLSNMEIQSNCALFESVKTLSRKSELLVTLESLATDPSCSVSNRIEHLQAVVLAPSFRTKMLSHHRYEPLTFAWLKQWMASIGELLGLYTPPHKTCYEQLLKATKTPVLHLGKLRAQFGLFPDPPSDQPKIEPEAVQRPLA